MTQIHTGGCQCGAVRYSATGEIGLPHICHCRMCQKAAGNYFMPFGGVKYEDFALTRGEPTWFQSSDSARRGFCAICGTPLFYDGGHDHISITLGSLDEPESVKPHLQANPARKMAWFGELDMLPGDPRMDTSPQDDAEIAKSSRQHPDHDTERWPPGARP
ncbi:GFA family protein [Neorhizobium sp. T786]|uniref:GFA family protein n=1 Tax=Pseudorhizobium xiangyangii TaxID=2883104 RepID=UPI001CFFD611|nr:GFA family protein [Neorhizobium xiangyangii]MCB5203362.1 GFA family protein [Neorhizobium xiangyangii]